jgi:ribonuclease HI
VLTPRGRPRRRPGTVPAVPDATTPTLFEPPSGREPVVVYTDGACSGNPAPAGGPGWWRPTASAVHRAVSADDTNQRMELSAALEALRALSQEMTEGRPIEVVSDST